VVLDWFRPGFHATTGKSLKISWNALESFAILKNVLLKERWWTCSLIPLMPVT
jgi:hypothetical protein